MVRDMSDEAKGRLLVSHRLGGGAGSASEGIGALDAVPDGLRWSIKKLLGRGQCGLVAWGDIDGWEFSRASGGRDLYGVVVSWAGGQAMLLNSGPEAVRRYSLLTEQAMKFIPAERFTVSLD